MKEDKGLIRSSGQTWAEWAGSILEPFVEKCFYSLREEQFVFYSKRIPSLERMDCIFDRAIAAGPLRGILSAWLELQTSLIVLPTDMPELPQAMLQELTEACKERSGGFAVACFATPHIDKKKKEIHPFPSFWEKSVLEKTYGKIQKGKLEEFSVTGLIQKNQPLFVTLPLEKRPFLQSKNRPEELRQNI